MAMQANYESGFSAFELLLGVVVLTLISTVSLYVYHNQNKNINKSGVKSSSTSSLIESGNPVTGKIPSVRVKSNSFISPDKTFSLNFPTGWNAPLGFSAGVCFTDCVGSIDFSPDKTADIHEIPIVSITEMSSKESAKYWGELITPAPPSGGIIISDSTSINGYSTYHNETKAGNSVSELYAFSHNGAVVLIDYGNIGDKFNYTDFQTQFVQIVSSIRFMN